MSNWSAIKAKQDAVERRAQFIAAQVGWTSGLPVADPDPSLYANQAELMQRLSWIYSAVSVVSESAASLAELEVFEQQGETETAIVNHEFEQLLRHPNDIQFDSQFEFFEAITGHLKLAGNCYLYLNAFSEDLPPAEIFVLRPDRMTVVPDKKKFIGGYYYTVEGVPLWFEPWEIIHLKKPHPLNDWYGLSAIESLAMAAESDYNMAQWNRNFFDKGMAKPQGALAYADMIDDGDWEQKKLEAQQEYGGTRRRMLMLRGVGTGGVQWLNMAYSQKDMEFLAGRQFTKEEIWTTLAPGLLQLMDKNVTEANSTAGEKTLREYVLWPMLVRIAQKFTARVLPRYASASGKALVGRFKDIRHRDRRLELDERAAYERTHTIDESREKFDQDDPLPDERGSLLPAQVTTVALPMPGQELSPTPAPKVAPEPTTNADGEPSDSQENPGADETKAAGAHSGTMVALAIPEDVGKKLLAAIGDKLPEGSEPSRLDELHLTLGYLGDVAEVSFAREQLETAVRIFAAQHAPLRGTIGGIGRMATMTENDTAALYALFDSPELPAFRQALVETLTAGGIAVDATHGFVPHITLAYVPVAATEIPSQLPDVPVQFPCVIVAWAGNWESILLSSGIPEPEPRGEDDALKAELGKWERKCLRRLDEHGKLADALDFESEAIVPTLRAAIAGALEAAGDALAVKAVFADALEWRGYP